MKFNYNLPVNLVFGRGRVAEIGTIAAAYGRRACIVTGTGSTKRSGLLDRTIGYLKEAGVESVTFDKITANPLTTTAKEGAAFAKTNQCDVIVGLGGGSIMDAAKAIAFLCVNEVDISDYIFNIKKSEEALPIILVPTTCGTGSEGNGFAVLTNPNNGDKKSLRCNAILAKASIVDSELMMTMPKNILASVGFDAFCHCMEAYISKIGQPLTDMMSLSGMELIGKHLVNLYQGSEEADAWDAVSWASTIGGMVINTAGVTVAHGMEHPASGLRNIVHGRGLAALTPVVMEATIDGCQDKCARIAACLDGSQASDLVPQIRRLLQELDLTTTLSEQGIKETDIDWMTENCFKVSAAGISYHPVTFGRNEIRKLYEKAL